VLTPDFFTPLAEPPDKKPELFVIVDTEEEFDWTAPFARENVGVTAIAEAFRLQNVAGAYGLRPTYVVDYPVASTPASAETLAGFAANGECHIGAHLHPWVTPPFDEPVTREMSFACNLGPGLERAKIEALTEMIETRMRIRPRVYKAGRYGFAESTAGILESLRYDVDASVIPHMDFSAEKGPDFTGFSVRPATFGRSRRMLELPCTLDFVGAARRIGASLHRVASARVLEPVRAVGILSRSGLVNKVMLSPEGNTLDEMKALTRALLADGVRTFALTFHSPSLKPACTPYVRTTAERDAFVATIDRYFDYFFAEVGGKPTSAGDIFDAIAS
jgi:hypothetical protein